MKRLITFIICLIISLDIIDTRYCNNKVYSYIRNYYVKNKYYIVVNEEAIKDNKYKYKEYSSKIKSTNDFYPKNKEDLLNIYYTFLNNGLDDFSYYCSKEYKNCLDDIKEISNDAKTFSYLNHLVHPYYSYKKINSEYNNLSKRVDVSIEKKYSKEEIQKIDDKINQITNELNINSYNSIIDKIKVFHDYLANTNVYDKEKELNTSYFNSDTAIGTLFEGYSVCSGYSDTMAIFLTKLGLDNVIVITDKHAWNAVKIDDVWYHIDLTWDDPIVSDGSHIILHDYFLVTTDELYKKDFSQHNFNKEIYNFLN